MRVGRRFALAGLISIAVAGCDSTERDWKTASTANSRATYEEFLKNHPGSAHEPVAKERALQLAWAEAVATNSIEGFAAFLKRDAIHRYRDEARQGLMKLRWHAATSDGSVEAFHRFFSTQDADVDKVTEAGRALGSDKMKILSDRLKTDFETARSVATSLSDIDAVTTRFGGFEFGLAAIEDLEQRWVEALSKDGVQNRFTIAEIVAKKGLARSSFTMVERALFDQPQTSFSFKTEQEGAFGRGQYDTPTAVYVTELPKDRLALSSTALLATMFGVQTAGKEKTEREELLQVYGPDSIWRYHGASKNIIGNIDEIQGTGPRGGRLTFFLVDGKGLVYMRGSGRVRLSDGREVLLSPQDPAGTFIERPPLQSKSIESNDSKK